MTHPELHPDDLVDKEARGTLTAQEQERLEQHRNACAPCRFESAVRLDFRAELEASGRIAVPFPPLTRRSRTRSGVMRARRKMPATRRWLVLAAAALLLASTAAAARWSYGTHWFMGVRRGTEHEPGSTPRARPTAAAMIQAPFERQDREESPSSAVSASPAMAPTPPPAMGSGSARSSMSSVSVVSSARPAERVHIARTSPPPQPSASQPTVAAMSAAAMFEGAREARERGAYDDAVHGYQELTLNYPQSEEAITSHAILGRLLLDRGLPQQALVHFDVYLASGRPLLDEEARVGRAAALTRLNRASDEAEAWAELLASHPNSVHAPRARRRIAELAGR